MRYLARTRAGTPATVAPAGTYALTLALPTGSATLPTVEIPGDRTRMRVFGDAGRP